MQADESLYRVSVNTSGLIFAVVVGLWAAYLVPMWLRRQDELNESRPTERFSTAIRLLSGRAALERRTARDTERRRERAAEDGAAGGAPESADPHAVGGAPGTGGRAAAPPAVPDLRGYADPVTEIRPQPAAGSTTAADGAPHGRTGPERAGSEHPAAERAGHRSGARRRPAETGGNRNADAVPSARSRPASSSTVRSRVLARRRRTTMVLFLAFALSGITCLTVGRPSLLWIPAIPGVLLTVYIWHLRNQERRRYALVMDRRRAEDAARRLHERTRQASAEPERGPSPAAEGRRALVEETDHAEWVDQQRQRETSVEDGDAWEPAPVPLPTYVNAPVAPRRTRGVDLEATDTWSAARSTTAGAGTGGLTGASAPSQERTPLFDQHADEEQRPRAAGE